MKKRLLAVVTAALLLVGCAGTGEKNAVSSDVTTRIPATENEAVTEVTEKVLEQDFQLAEETQTEEETVEVEADAVDAEVADEVSADAEA